MRGILWLTAIGFLSGIVLIAVLKLIMLWTGNTAYILLFNFDYIPVIQDLRPEKFFGYVFHFVTCCASVIGLFLILRIWQKQWQIWPYVLVYMLGGGALFFLTALSPKPPDYDDVAAWMYWTLAHGVFGWCVGYLIQKLKFKLGSVSINQHSGKRN
ncbi:MAG: hypothetical protein Q4G27_02440 [Flavobacteriaceae bacterium]|nr:hypothetical protein [Flavobacteriaceae bacterium]